MTRIVLSTVRSSFVFYPLPTIHWAGELASPFVAIGWLQYAIVLMWWKEPPQ